MDSLAAVNEPTPSKKAMLDQVFNQWHIDATAFPEPLSPSDIFALFHHNVVEKAKTEEATNFKRIQTKHGELILHEDFLVATEQISHHPKPEIVQDDLKVPTDEQWSDLCEELRDTGVIQLLSEYLDGIHDQRELHNQRLTSAFSSLPEIIHNDILKIIPSLRFGGTLSHLVGAVSPFDKGEATTWENFGVTTDDITRISDWAKITGSGVVLASPDFQSGQKSHDYVTYAMIKAANMGISLRDQMVKNTCLHEGRGHGFIDAILDHYLGYSTKYSTEGFAGAMGQDNRIKQSVTDDELRDFIADNKNRDTDRMYDIGYRIMPVFLTRLHQAIMDKTLLNEEQAWTQIVTSSIKAAYELSMQDALTADDKHAQFLPKVLKDLNFDNEYKESILQSSVLAYTPLVMA